LVLEIDESSSAPKGLQVCPRDTALARGREWVSGPFRRVRTEYLHGVRPDSLINI